MSDAVDERPGGEAGTVPPSDDGVVAGGRAAAGANGDRWFALVSIVAIVALLAGAAGWGLGRSGADATEANPAMDPAAATHDHAAGAPAAGDHHAGEAKTGTGGHVHEDGPPVPLDAATQAAFSREMQVAREATMRIPNVAAAKQAGLVRVGTFAPGSGAHYMQRANRDDPSSPGRKALETFDVANPLMWLFAGNEDTSPVVGLMYYSLGKDKPPAGFAGPNDRWHQHKGLCLGDAANGDIVLPLPVDRDATKEQCDAAKGRFLESTGWMAHLWSAPGWESPQGVFSHDHPLLVCTDGKTAAEAELHVGCKGLS